jgi:hypothetical protein
VIAINAQGQDGDETANAKNHSEKPPKEVLPAHGHMLSQSCDLLYA